VVGQALSTYRKLRTRHEAAPSAPAEMALPLA
jgi:hypothetical protein